MFTHACDYTLRGPHTQALGPPACARAVATRGPACARTRAARNPHQPVLCQPAPAPPRKAQKKTPPPAGL